jgi:hypothetical protein
VVLKFRSLQIHLPVWFASLRGFLLQPVYLSPKMIQGGCSTQSCRLSLLRRQELWVSLARLVSLCRRLSSLFRHPPRSNVIQRSQRRSLLSVSDFTVPTRVFKKYRPDPRSDTATNASCTSFSPRLLFGTCPRAPKFEHMCVCVCLCVTVCTVFVTVCGYPFKLRHPWLSPPRLRQLRLVSVLVLSSFSTIHDYPTRSSKGFLLSRGFLLYMHADWAQQSPRGPRALELKTNLS